MSDIHEVAAEKPLSTKDQKAKTNALIAYVCMAIGFFTGIFWFVGAIWAMVSKGKAKGTIFEDHYSNIIKVFWWSLVWSIIGFVLIFAIVGYFILLVLLIWLIFRIVKGLFKITSNQSYNS